MATRTVVANESSSVFPYTFNYINISYVSTADFSSASPDHLSVMTSGWIPTKINIVLYHNIYLISILKIISILQVLNNNVLVSVNIIAIEFVDFIVPRIQVVFNL